MSYDPWHGQPVEDGPPFVGRMALLVGTLAVTAGALTAAGLAAVGGWLLHRGRR